MGVIKMAHDKYIGIYEIFGQSPYIHKREGEHSKLMYITTNTKIPKYVDGKESTDFYSKADLINIVNSISAFIDKNKEQPDGN
jgi:hypothetical protein